MNIKLILRREQQPTSFKLSFKNTYDYSDGGYERGLTEGYENGFAEGEIQGRSDGYAEGQSKGYAEGQIKGYEEGQTKGYTEGYTNGYAQGDADGNARGESAGFANALSRIEPLQVSKNGVYAPLGDSIGFGSVNVNIPWETNFWIGVLFGGDVYGGATPGSITLPNDLKQVPMYAYAYKNTLKHVSVPDGVTIIMEGAFQDCTNLATMALPASLERLEGDVFVRCPNLILDSLPDNLKSIGGSSFAYCSKLRLTKLPASLESLGSYAFYGCTSILGNPSSIPASVKHIGNYAFGGCTQLKEIHFSGKPDYISPTAFSGCDAFRFYVPWSEGEVDNAPWGCNGAHIYYNW